MILATAVEEPTKGPILEMRCVDWIDWIDWIDWVDWVDWGATSYPRVFLTHSVAGYQGGRLLDISSRSLFVGPMILKLLGGVGDDDEDEIDAGVELLK
jgi:hypothetical protein